MVGVTVECGTEARRDLEVLLMEYKLGLFLTLNIEKKIYVVTFCEGIVTAS